MFVKQQTVRNFIGFYLVVEQKASLQFDACTGFRPLFKYPYRCDEISTCGWASSEFPKC